MLEIDGLELVFDVVTGEKSRVFLESSRALFRGANEGYHFSVRFNVGEESRRDAPEGAAVVLGPLDGGECFVVDEDFVPASDDAAASEVLHLHASLSENAAVRDGDRELGAIGEPDVQTGEAALAVEGHKVEVAVEASEDGVDGMVLGEIRGSGGKQMGTKAHQTSEGVLL